MEEKNRNIENEINLTFESLNGIKPADANPYLFEKVMHKIQEHKNVNYGTKLKYALIITLLILINIVTFVYFSGGSNDSTLTNTDDAKTTFKKEYSLTVSDYQY